MINTVVTIDYKKIKIKNINLYKLITGNLLQ
jgi:hypothetical protein